MNTCKELKTATDFDSLPNVGESSDSSEYSDDRSKWALYTPIENVHKSFVWKYFKIYDPELHSDTYGTVVCTLCHYIYHGESSCTELSIRRSHNVLNTHLKTYHEPIYEQERSIQLHNDKSKDDDFQRWYLTDVITCKAVSLRQQRNPSLLRRNLKRFAEPTVINKGLLNIAFSVTSECGVLHCFLVETAFDSILPLRLIDAKSSSASGWLRSKFDLNSDSFSARYDEPRSSKSADLLLIAYFVERNENGASHEGSSAGLEELWVEFQQIHQLLSETLKGRVCSQLPGHVGILELKSSLPVWREISDEANTSTEIEIGKEDALSLGPVHVVSQPDVVSCCEEEEELEVVIFSPDRHLSADPQGLSSSLNVLASVAALAESDEYKEPEVKPREAVFDEYPIALDKSDGMPCDTDPVGLSSTKEEALIIDLCDTESIKNEAATDQEESEDWYWDASGLYDYCVPALSDDRYSTRRRSDSNASLDLSPLAWSSSSDLRRAFRSRCVPVSVSTVGTPLKKQIVVLSKQFNLPKNLEPSQVFLAKSHKDDIHCTIALQWGSEGSAEAEAEAEVDTAKLTTDSAITTMEDSSTSSVMDVGDAVDKTLCSYVLGSSALECVQPEVKEAVMEVVESLFSAATAVENLTTVHKTDENGGKRKREPAQLKFEDSVEFKKSRYTSKNAFYYKEFYFGHHYDWKYRFPPGEFNIDERPVDSEQLLPLHLPINNQMYMEQLSTGVNVSGVFFHYHYTSRSSDLRDDFTDNVVLETRRSISCPWCSHSCSYQSNESFISSGHSPESFEALQLLLSHFKTDHSGFRFLCRIDQYNNVHVDVHKRLMKGAVFNRYAPFCYVTGDKVPDEVIEAEVFRYPTRRSGPSNPTNNAGPLLNDTQDGKYALYEQYSNPISFVVIQDSDAGFDSDADSNDLDFELPEPFDDGGDYDFRPRSSHSSSSSAVSATRSKQSSSKKARMGESSSSKNPMMRKSTLSDTSAFMEHRLLKGYSVNSAHRTTNGHSGASGGSVTSSSNGQGSSQGVAISDVDTAPSHFARFGRKKRQYYHCQTNHPIRRAELNYNSDDQLDTSYELSKQLKCLDEFTDVSKEEKRFMKLWNTHLSTFCPYGDRLLPVVCEAFLEKHWKAVMKKKLRHNLLLHFFNLHDFGLLTQKEVYEYMAMFDAKRMTVSIVNRK